MGIDALRAAVEEEARANVAALLDEARAHARALGAEAAEEASARRRRSLRDEEARLRSATARRIAAARGAAQARVLEARDVLLDRVFALACDQLRAALDSPAALQRMVDLVEEAIGHLSAGRVVIACSSELAEPFVEAFAGREDVRIEPDPEMPCGFRAHGPDHAVIVDATLAKLLELRRPMLAIEVLQRLERGDKG
ncbi:MAG: hypothetical protein JRH17_22505 [Deltaproteobacteria bacterium]|nr:hypothetical protein [Deltaproteobacteria bacterium]MBW2698598.1 hypothetical protein [Deltaproteobacteria bacterium]